MAEEPYSGRRAQDAEQAGETAVIRAEMEETRVRISRDLDEIGERLNPQHVKEQIKDNIREATIGRVENMARGAADRVGETKRGIMDTVRENPIPAAMAAIGIGWLYMNGRKQTRSANGGRGSDASRQWGAGYPGSGAYSPPQAYGYGSSNAQSEQGALERVKEGAGAVGETLREKAGGVAEGAQQAAEKIVDVNRQQVRRLEDTFFENPLAIGAATVALGIAAGLAAPRTHAEVKLMGDVRDQVADRVSETASETADKAQRVAERVFDETKTAAQQEGLTR